MPSSEWTDINPKVTAAGLAYAGSLAALALLEEAGVVLEAITAQSVSGFFMLLAAYLRPGR